MSNRRYLPTFADLVDRLSICQLKEIYIPENKEAYRQEMDEINHDINLIIKEKSIELSAELIHAAQIVQLANRVIWENESKARQGGTEQDKLLKFTHSINGIRNNAKNSISVLIGERVDLKVDCMAAELPKEMGNWDIFKDEKES